MATGHLRPRKDKNGKITGYQLTIEGEKDPLTGKRDRHYKTVKGSKKLAEATLRKMIGDLENGTLLTQSSMKLSDWMKQWMSLYLPNIEATTRASYNEKINCYIVPTLGNIQLKSLKTSTVQAWVNTLTNEKKLAPKTVKNAYLNLKASLDKAVVLQMIPNNPCIGVELPKAVKYEAEIYDTKEIEKALKLAEGTDMYLILLLTAYVGFRRGEIAALRWEHIDLANGIIHVKENRVIADGKVITKAPKSSSGTRDITIGNKLLDELKAAHTDYITKKQSQSKTFVDTGFVICQPNGKPYNPESIAQKWERFLKKHDLKKIRFHDLRHSCATMMAEAGVSPKVMQQRLGHADIGITMNTYTHTTRAMDAEAAKLIDNITYSKATTTAS